MTITEFLFPLRKGKRSAQVLAALYYLKHERDQEQASTTEIRQALVDAGVPQARKINISQGLNQAAPFAQRVGPHGIWEITPSGEDHVADELALPIAQPQARHDVKDLQALAAKVNGRDRPRLHRGGHQVPQGGRAPGGGGVLVGWGRAHDPRDGLGQRPRTRRPSTPR